MNDKEVITILENQLSIMSALQRFEYFVHQKEIEEDLSERIKDTQNILSNKTQMKYDLIKYLEDKIKEYYKQEIIDGESYDGGYNACCEDILERVKSSKYE